MFKIGMGQSWLFKVPIIKDVLDRAVQERVLRLRSAQDRIQQAQREEAQRLEAGFMLGEPVLVLSNEWKEPMVGVLVSVDEVQHYSGAKSFLPVVEEAFTKEKFCVFGIVRPLSIPMLKAVDKLNPSERWMLASRYGSQVPHPSNASNPTMSLYERVKNETDYFERFKLEAREMGGNFVEEKT